MHVYLTVSTLYFGILNLFRPEDEGRMTNNKTQLYQLLIDSQFFFATERSYRSRTIESIVNIKEKKNWSNMIWHLYNRNIGMHGNWFKETVLRTINWEFVVMRQVRFFQPIQNSEGNSRVFSHTCGLRDTPNKHSSGTLRYIINIFFESSNHFTA